MTYIKGRYRRGRERFAICRYISAWDLNFWKYVDKGDGCWEWKAERVRNRYGRFCIGKKKFLAHRISWYLHHGEMPSGLVCHKCDNPPCVRPDHLFLGDHKSNAEDMVRKGRDQASRGYPNGNAKLTPNDVMAIRSSDKKLKEIAAEYGVAWSYVSAIRRRRTWKTI